MIRATPSAFGALPAILVTAVMTMIKMRLTDAQIARQLGEQYEEIQRLNESQIIELSLLLAEQTDTPSWRWFSIIRDAIEIGLLNPNPPPPPPPEEEETTDNTALWIGVGVGALILIIALR